jgi:hypothetical protein
MTSAPVANQIKLTITAPKSYEAFVRALLTDPSSDIKTERRNLETANEAFHPLADYDKPVISLEKVDGTAWEAEDMETTRVEKISARHLLAMRFSNLLIPVTNQPVKIIKSDLVVDDTASFFAREEQNIIQFTTNHPVNYFTINAATQIKIVPDKPRLLPIAKRFIVHSSTAISRLLN